MPDVLREIVPIDHAGVLPDVPLPRLDWLPISSLRVNPAYQRDATSRRSQASIERIVDGWDWSRVKALSVQPLDGDLFEITDGQHTAIAAATLGIEALPALITTGGAVVDAAQSFVGINRDRVAVQPLAMFWAEVAAKKETACDVVAGAEQAGACLMRSQRTGRDEYKVGEVVAVKRLKLLAEQGGPAYVKSVLHLGVDCELAPVDVLWVRAFELLLWGGPAFEPRLSHDAIVTTVVGIGDEQLVEMAAARAKQSKIAKFLELANTLFSLTNKRAAA